MYLTTWFHPARRDYLIKVYVFFVVFIIFLWDIKISKMGKEMPQKEIVIVD